MFKHYFAIFNKKEKQLLIFLAFILITFIVFFPVIYGQPLWDDWVFIFRNEYFYKQSIFSYFPGGSQSRSWPIFYSIIWILIRIFKEHYFYYHFLSLFLHGVNGFLIWKILTRFKVRYAFLVATLFLIHPAQLITVGWIIQIKTIISLFFFLSSIWTLTNFYDTKKNLFLFVSISLFILSVLTKATPIAAIALMPFLYRFIKNAYAGKKILFFLLPFLLISLYSLVRTSWTYILVNNNISSIVTNLSTPSDSKYELKTFDQGKEVSVDRISFSDRLLLSTKVFSKNIQFLFFPFQNFFFQPKVSLVLNSLEFILILAVLFFIIFIYQKLALINNPIYKSGILFFIFSLVPFCGIIYLPIFTYSNFIPYWLTIPLIGLLPAISHFTTKSKYLKIAIIYFAAISHFQSYSFIKVENLILDSIEKSPTERSYYIAAVEQLIYNQKCNEAKRVFFLLPTYIQDIETVLREKIAKCYKK